MKRLAFLLAAVVLFTPACDDDDPVDPSCFSRSDSRQT